MKPELKYQDGKLIAAAVAGVDTDKDGIMSAGVKVEMYIDAQEAVNEIIKQEVPAWLKELVEKKAQEQV